MEGREDPELRTQNSEPLHPPSPILHPLTTSTQHSTPTRRLLIVNADDFGISEGVNLGVVEAHRRGILTSTTIMANMPAFEHATSLRRENPTLGVGMHLNLTSGHPILPPERIPGLVGPSGRLLPIGTVLRMLTLGRLPLAQVEAEFAAQIEKALNAGLAPTHLDSHHHVHMHPRVHSLVIRLALRYGIRAIRATAEMGLTETISRAGMLLKGEETLTLSAELTARELGSGEDSSRTPMASGVQFPIVPNLEGRSPAPETPRAIYVKSLSLSLLGVVFRWRARRACLLVPDHFRGLLLGTAFTAEQLHLVLRALPTGNTELMTHPGYPDNALRDRTSYSAGREPELAALTSPATRAAVEQLRVELQSFAAL